MLILLLLKSADGKIRKSKLIAKLEEEKIIRIRDESVTELSDAAKHSQLRAILDPTEKDWNFIMVESSGSRSEVSLTDQGDTALKIFGVDNNEKK